MRILSVLTVGTLLLATNSSYSYAGFEVISPTIEESVMEIESENHVNFDHRDELNHARKHELEITYGINSWWKLGVEGEMEKEPGDHLKNTANSLINQFAFTEQGEYWMDVGGRVEYEFANGYRAPDELAVILLFEKEIGAFVHTANIALEKQIGYHNGTDTELGISWRSKYFFKPWLNPGFEYYGEFGEISNFLPYREQEQHIGPVISGDLGYGFEYDLGYLVGISKGSADGVLKFNIEYELPVN